MVIRAEAMVGEGEVGSEAGVDEGRGDVVMAVVRDGGGCAACKAASARDRQTEAFACMRVCVRGSDLIVQ